MISTSAEETKAIGATFVTSLEKGGVVCLEGDLAAGKTTFSQGIAEALGIHRLTSPTFLIMKEYEITNHPQIHKLFHLDLYRLTSPEDIKSFDLEEIIANPHNLVLVEWSDRIKSILPEKRFRVDFKYIDEDKREIYIERPL